MHTYTRAVTIALLGLLSLGIGAAQSFPAILNMEAEVKPTDAALIGPNTGALPVFEGMKSSFATRAQADALLAIANRDLHRSGGPACELHVDLASFQFPPFWGLVYLHPDGPRVWLIRCTIDVPYRDQFGRLQIRQVKTANYVGYMVYRRATGAAFNYGHPFGDSIGFYEYFEGDGTLVWTAPSIVLPKGDPVTTFVAYWL